MKLRTAFLAFISAFSVSITQASSYDDPLNIGANIQKLNRYKDHINLDESRSIYPTYVAPSKVSTTREVEYIKKVFNRYSIIAGIGTQHTVGCNKIGVEYALLDFLKTNKDLNKTKYMKEVQDKESELKSLISFEWASSNKTCKEIYNR